MANKLPTTSDRSPKKTSGKAPTGKNRKTTPAASPEQQQIRIPGDVSRPIHQIIPVVLCALAVFLMICFIFTGTGAIAGDIMRNLFFGLFGRVSATLVPFALIALGLLWRQSIRNHCITSRIVCIVLMLALLSCLVYTTVTDKADIRTFNISSFYSDGDSWSSGGVIGNTLAFLLVNLFDTVGTFIFCAVIFIVFAIICFGFTPSVIADRLRNRAANTVAQKQEERRVLRQDRDAHKEEIRQFKQEARRGEQRIKLASRAEEERTRVETKYEQRRTRTAQKEEERRRKNEYAAQVKNNQRISNARFKDQFDIALEDDTMHDAAPVEDPQDMGGEIVTRRADELLQENDLQAAFKNEKQTVEDLTALAEHVKQAPAAAPMPFDIHTKSTRAAATVPQENSDAASETAPAPKTKRAPDAKPAAPSVPLVTEDMISTKTHIDVGDKPTATAEALSPEEAERNKEKEALEQMYATYSFPPLSLLTPSEETDTGNITEEINANAAKLVETLNSFSVRTRITSVSRGPRITRYELVPDAGVRIRSIANLIDDISMNLASAGIRIEAPIPGKSAVGVEVPNKISSIVRLRELVETEAFQSAGPRTTVCVGADVTGDPVFCDLAKMPHMLIAGATGMGKSVCINTIITSILYKARPDEVKLILVDPKKVELGVYNGIPHLLVPVVIDPKKAAGALSWAVCEMERRFDLIEEVGVRDLKGYNKEVEANRPEYEKLPHIIIIIDELNDLMMVASDTVEASICRIAQKARAAGIHLIIGTQRPSVDVITGTIKANIPSRIAFHVASQIDSRTILDTTGAEKLLNNGDMLFYAVGAPKPQRVQCAFISDGEVEKIASFLKQNVPVDAYNKDIMADIERESEKCTQNGKKSGDGGSVSDDERDENLTNPKFREAVEIAIDEGKISTSLIQRRLKLGFGKAARFIDIMENMGIVSAPDGQKPRTTLINKDQYYELLSRAEDHRNE